MKYKDIKNITDKINEAFDTRNIDLYGIAKVNVPGRKRKVGIAVYNFDNFKDTDTKLDYQDQIIFKYYCLYKWGVKYEKYEGLHPSWVPVDSFDVEEKKKYNFYFDNIDCVDASNDKTILGVKCDGKQTFAEAKKVLEEYFNI